jgi:hypothetical protein
LNTQVGHLLLAFFGSSRHTSLVCL